MASARSIIIYNPAAGKGRAGDRLNQYRHSIGDHVRFLATKHPGHAETMAYEAAEDGTDVVFAAGGDGTVHEVANGILRSENSDVQFCVLPLGSANDYAFSLKHGLSTDAVAADVGRVRDHTGRVRYFVCCMGLGLNSAVTLEARRINGLQGLALYGLATLRAMTRHFHCPQMRVEFDDGTGFTKPTLMMSVLVGRREGGFVMAPHARLDDGIMEYVHAAALTRWEVAMFLPRLALAGPPEHHPRVQLGRCRSIRLQSAAPLTVHIDGEFFCTKADEVRWLEIDVLPGALRIHRRITDVKTPTVRATPNR